MTLFLLLALTAPSAPPQSPSSPLPLSSSNSPISPDQAKTLIGNSYLQLGRIDDAKTQCDAAFQANPTSAAARDCLDRATEMLIDQDLNNADVKLLIGDKASAIALASKWARAGARRDDQRVRAWNILAMARSTRSANLTAIYTEITPPEWLRQLLITITALAGLALLLFAIRKLWREWQRGKYYGTGGTTEWSLRPLQESPVVAGAPTGFATDAVLDALARLGHELERDIWQPTLLLLRPTPPANYEPAIISDFLSDELHPIALVPGARDLCLEWQLHDVQLDEAVQSLQLKTSAGIDIGSVARFLRSIVEWIIAGAPTISGAAETEADKSVSVHLAARGGPIKSIAVTTSTDFAPGIDPLQLSAERIAFKFLLRMRYPGMTNDEIDGFAALRQGAGQFAQYAGTALGVGPDASVRTSSLAKSAFNFNFFRASIPLHFTPVDKSDNAASIMITDAIRQAVLLAEGVAHSLVGVEQDLTSAKDCFRQLQDWPGSPETEILRQQAAYNEAIVWQQSGDYRRSVLMLTELLGERAPDTVVQNHGSRNAVSRQSVKLPDAIRFPIRLARLAAFAKYSRDDWSTLPKLRVKLLVEDAEQLIKDLVAAGARDQITKHDKRMTDYMYAEALRSIGHVELLRLVMGSAAVLYRDNRPIGLKTTGLAKKDVAHLQRAIDWMLKCEERNPSCGLYCDLAEAYLLLKDFQVAQGYARHATLECIPTDKPERDPCCERSYYLAAETFFLQGTEGSLEFAKKYSFEFQGPITLEEFKGVRKDLGII
jgi:tetratricopeptide (TPR) repeat protein